VLSSGEDENDEFSASRTIDYSNDRLEACIFYTSEGESMGLEAGAYLIEILEEEVVIGSVSLGLR
jgi:hypothetical protein